MSSSASMTGGSPRPPRPRMGSCAPGPWPSRAVPGPAPPPGSPSTPVRRSARSKARSWSCAARPPPPPPPPRPPRGERAGGGGRPRGGGAPPPRHILASERVYLVPRGDGRLIVGATVEEMGFDTAVTAGGVHELLREAYRLLPDIAEMELLGATAGLRPGTPDNLPLVGPGAIDGLVLATGHFRNGILLAPLAAQAVADLLGGGVRPFPGISTEKDERAV